MHHIRKSGINAIPNPAMTPRFPIRHGTEHLGLASSKSIGVPQGVGYRLVLPIWLIFTDPDSQLLRIGRVADLPKDGLGSGLWGKDRGFDLDSITIRDRTL